jgi:hypothetical protein
VEIDLDKKTHTHQKQQQKGVLYTMALPLILYQQLLLYDKFVIVRGFLKKNLF